MSAPSCTCVDTLRGTDTLGCPTHDSFDAPEPTPDELRSLIAEQAALMGFSVDDVLEMARYDELPQTPQGYEIARLLGMLGGE